MQPETLRVFQIDFPMVHGSCYNLGTGALAVPFPRHETNACVCACEFVVEGESPFWGDPQVLGLVGKDTKYHRLKPAK